MRFLLYNMRYAVGSGLAFHWPIPGLGYIKDTAPNLRRIVDFVVKVQPDVAGLVEVDTGSIRTHSINQADAIADALGQASSYQTKYGEYSFTNRVPILRNQGNAFITGTRISNQRIHYFDAGIKRLILELELERISFFLVHLSLKYRHRHYQLQHLHALIRQSDKPVIVAGDFNTLRGDYEIELFMAATGLQNANKQAAPSYPSRAPRKQLDFILHSDRVRVRDFHMPRVTWSDHLPLICDFDVDVNAAGDGTDRRS